MAPAASASILSAAASSKRAPASDAEPEPPLELDSSFSAPIHQGGDDEAARKGQQPKQQLECPRCQSTNTKFCYYNNYSTAQPRHFCRACRRYWTHGGTLRDVPVGGASRRSAGGGGGGGKRRRVEGPASSASPPPTEAMAAAPHGLAADADACLTGLSAAFPFLSDGSFLPHFDFDLGAAPAAFSSWHSVVPGFYDGLAQWDDGTAGAAAWGDIAGGGLDLGWTPPGN